MDRIIQSFMNCFAKTPTVKRSPTCQEIMSGVPEWWSVSETLVSKIYISETGKQFDSVQAVTRWREHGPFEDPDWNVPSF